MSTTDLARKVDLPVPTVHRLVTGKSTRPYRSSLKPIADFFSLEIDQLLGEKDIPDEESENNNDLSSSNNIKTIPIISWDEIEEFENLNISIKSKIVALGNTNKNCFALIMNDYSMEPLFAKDSILIFDPSINAPDRSFVLVKLENRKTPIFRQLIIDAEHKYLKPLNPDLGSYQMKILGANDNILACLFESRNSFRKNLGIE